MSKSILKQSFELFDSIPKESAKIEEAGSQSKNKKQTKGINHRVTKSLPLEKKYRGKTIDQIRKQYSKQKDHTGENLRKLSSLSRKLVSKESSHLIFKRANRSNEEPVIVKPEEGTVFTEEDFAMFEREYVVD